MARTLLALDLIEITGDEIGKHFSSRKKQLPDYCIRNDNGEITQTENYLQFVSEGEEKYLLFNYFTADSILDEEIQNCGLEDLLKNIDLRPYVSEFKNLIKYEDYGKALSTSNYLVIDLIYTGGSYYEPYDYDMDVEVVGVLDSKLTLKEIPYEEKIQKYYNKEVNPKFYSTIKIVDSSEKMITKKGKQYLEPGFVWAPYIPTEHTKESLDDYNTFMKKYKELHAACPKCGGTGCTTTLVGFIMMSDNREAYEDLNDCVCYKCGDKHTYHERVPLKK